MLDNRHSIPCRGLPRIAAILALATGAVAAAPAHAGEIVPSVGLTRTVDGDATTSNLGLALRGNMLGPVLQSEIGVSYRREEYYDGALEATMVPITASLLLRPVPMLHADAGAGWYHTKYDYRNPLLPNETKQDFGVHVGGGLQIPVAPRAAVDLTGRYVFLEDQESRLIPSTFNPDYWSMSLGLALKF